MKRIDVEPLSEQRWARVERELFEELDRGEAPARPAPAPRTRPALVWGAALCAACALLAFALWPHEPEVARLLQVETAAEARTVEFAGARVRAEPRSALTLSGDDMHGALAALAGGAVEFEVPAQRAERAPFVVQAGGVRVRVQGGAVRVAYLASETHVTVHRGTVEVVTAEARVLLGAGDTWPSAKARARDGAPVTAPSARPAPSLEPPALPEATVVTGKPARSERHRTPRHSPESVRESRVEVAPEGDRARFERAARLEGTQPDEAAALYRQLSERTGSWAENALFALGRLELERGHHEAARAALTRYLARHPAGRNAEDAARLLRQVR